MGYLEVCYSFQEFRGFSVIFVIDFYDFICPENILCVISVILILSRFVLWPRLWYILATVPQTLGKKRVFCCSRK